MNARHLTLALALAAALVPAASLLTPAAAQDRGPVERVARGRVLDKSGAPIKGAVVYLRDNRSSAVRSAISTDDGSYRFVQLLQGTDYDLWAQVDQKKSKTRNISSFDTKNDVTLDLTVER
jgi:hypothetical protein